jgi:dihydrofolate reductase
MRKVVFSKTLQRSEWKNTELANGDLVDVITRLKNQKGKDMIVYGGPTVSSSIASVGLIDEFHFLVNPVMLGKGRSMLKDLDDKLSLQLLTATPYPCGLTVLKYALKK